ncbi:MAG: rod shape-determining protein [Candidatus Xenobia bacterium]
MRIGLDLGTSTVRLVEGRKLAVLCQPNLLLQDQHFPEVLAGGETARKMVGRTAQHWSACRPVVRSRLGSPQAARLLIKPMMEQAGGWRRFGRPRVMVATPLSSSPTERQAVADLLRQMGIKEVEGVATPLAAALGAVPTGHEPPPLVLVMGASVTEVALVSRGLVVSDFLQLGGQTLDQAMVAHLRRQHGLEVSLEAAEEVKRSVGSADPAHDQLTCRVYGRELESRLPHSVVLTGEEVRSVLAPPLSEVLRLVREVLDRTPPAMSSDVLQRGLTLTGGGAHLIGLDSYLARETGLPVQLAEEPENAVVRGTLGEFAA